MAPSDHLQLRRGGRLNLRKRGGYGFLTLVLACVYLDGDVACVILVRGKRDARSILNEIFCVGFVSPSSSQCSWFGVDWSSFEFRVKLNVRLILFETNDETENKIKVRTPHSIERFCLKF